MYAAVRDRRRNAFATALLSLWAVTLPGVVLGVLAGARLGSLGVVAGTYVGLAYSVPLGLLHAIGQLVALRPADPLRHRRRSRLAAAVVAVPVGGYVAVVLATNGLAPYASLVVLHAGVSWLLVTRLALPRTSGVAEPGAGPWYGPASPRRSHAPWTVLRWHALAFGVAGGLAGLNPTGAHPVVALLTSLEGFGAGLLAGLPHAGVQAVVSRRVRPGGEHPARELAATVTSFALALLTLTFVALRTTAGDRALAAWLAGCAAYVALTWPAARWAFRTPGDALARRP